MLPVQTVALGPDVPLRLAAHGPFLFLPLAFAHLIALRNPQLMDVATKLGKGKALRFK